MREGESSFDDSHSHAERADGGHEAHEAHEEHDSERKGLAMLKMHSDLPVEIEDAATSVIGCMITVHGILGPGFKELIYKRALCLELESQGSALNARSRSWCPTRSGRSPATPPI